MSKKQVFYDIPQQFSKEDKENIKRAVLDLLAGRRLSEKAQKMVGFDSAGWDKKSPAVMKEIIKAKMAHPALCLQLLATSMAKCPIAYLGRHPIWETDGNKTSVQDNRI